LLRDTAHLYAKPSNTYEQTDSFNNSYNSPDQLIKSNSFTSCSSNFNSPSHVVPYQQSLLKPHSNSFNHSPTSSFINLQHSSLDDEHSGPITYEIFMKQQQQEQQQQQNKMHCYYCNLYNDQTSFSSNSFDTYNSTDCIQEKHNDSLKLPLPSPSSVLQCRLLPPIPQRSLPSPIASCNTSTNITTAKQKSVRRTFSCSRLGCTKAYSALSHLRIHERKHAGLRRYSCTWPNCGWTFIRSDELRRHYRIHTGVKPYSCNQCDRAFARSDHLSIHMKSHSK
jgi:uncharacterized Zn-finger protein